MANSAIGSGTIAGGVAGNSGEVQFNSSGALGADSNLFWDDTNKRLGIKTSSPGTPLDVKGAMRFSGSTSGYVELAPAAVAGSAQYTLPTALPDSDKVLSCTTGGVMSWATAGSGTSFPVRPFSEIPLTAGKVFANVHVGSGSNGIQQEEGLGVMASLNGNATWSLRFQMPETLPSGTPKLRLIALAAANTGTAQVKVQWAPVAMGEDPSSASLNPGDTVSPAWSSGDSNKYKEVGPVSLTYYTIDGGDIVIVALNFLTSSWSLAAVSTWQASIIWE